VDGTDRGACVWFTGRHGAGKTTVARLVADELLERGVPSVLLDEDEPGVRVHLQRDDAGTPLPAIAWLAVLFAERGVIALVSADAPGRAARDDVRGSVARFVEIYVDSPPEVCGQRRGKIASYEEPFAPELRVPSHDRSPAASAAQVVSYLEQAGLLA
jgi:adenylylsulfate kinase